MLVIATPIGEWLGTKTFFIAQSRKQTEQNGGQAIATYSGIWLHEGDNFIHINSVLDKNHLEGVTRYQFNKQHRLLAAYYVKEMIMQGKQWVLRSVDKTVFSNEQIQSKYLPEATWDLMLNPNLLSVGMKEPAEMSLSSLYQYSNHSLQNGLRADNFRFEFWKRVFQPLTTIVMLLLAIPFVLRYSRTTTTGVRILFGSGVGFIFYLFNSFLGQFSVVFQVSPFFAAVLPTLVFAGVGYLSMRVNRA